MDNVHMQHLRRIPKFKLVIMHVLCIVFIFWPEVTQVYHTFGTLSSTKSPKFVTNLITAAKSVHYDNEILQKVAVTQAILESNSGKSQLSSKYNNYFGIKGRGTAGTVTLWTSEYLNGKRVRVRANFAVYKSVSDSLRQHQRLLNRKRYLGVGSAKNVSQAFTELYRAGYATDPKYPEKLMRVYKSRVEPNWD